MISFVLVEAENQQILMNLIQYLTCNSLKFTVASDIRRLIAGTYLDLDNTCAGDVSSSSGDANMHRPEPPLCNVSSQYNGVMSNLSNVTAKGEPTDVPFSRCLSSAHGATAETRASSDSNTLTEELNPSEMVTFTEWPELAVVTEKQRSKLVLNSVYPNKGKPSLNDERLQKTFFERNPHLNFINISGCGLSYLSPSVAVCSHLTELVIIRNRLTSVPEEVGSLTELVFVDLSSNILTRLPVSFSKLKLETLVVSGNQLTNEGLCDFSAMETLRVLNLSYNELTSVPITLTLGKLIHLHTLNLAHNKIEEATTELSVIGSLKNLNLSGNKITAVPWALGQMERIKALDLSQNPFTNRRFKRLVNSRRAKRSAVFTYITKNAPKVCNDASTEKQEATVASKKSVDEIPVTVRIGDPNMAVKRHDSISSLRPYLVCCVFNNLDLSGGNFKKIENLQTKLHASLCGNRSIAAIGTHELKAFVPPLQYLALPKDELNITALGKKTREFARKLSDALVRDAGLPRRRTKRNTLNLLNLLHRHRNLFSKLPDPDLSCLVDSEGLIISLAPVANSNLTKMSEETQSVWVEVSSAESLSICKEVLEQLVTETLLICPNLSLNQVRVYNENEDLLSAFPDENDLSKLSIRREFV